MTKTEGRRRAQDLGLVLGPVAALAVALALPETYATGGGDVVPFSAAGRATAAIAVWMATWWMTEAISVSATALLPLVLMPLLGAGPIKSAAAPYAHELIFLFMGGFLIALAMERWDLHRRIALATLALVGSRAPRVVAGFMAVAALLSMWVSNTATAVMLLPVATSVIDRVASGPGDGAGESERTAHRHFALCLLLGIAYGCSIGGMGTPIGTPPNVLLLSYAKTHLGREIGFARWMLFAVPLVVAFLPVTWLLLTRVLYPCGDARVEGGAALVADARRALGPMSRAERIVAAVFVAAAVLWMTRPLLVSIEVFGRRPLEGLSDAGIAMTAALVLFVAPADRAPRRFVLDWDTASRLPWGILVLFGGGLSLAAAIQRNGVGELVASQVAGLAGVPAVVVVLVVVAGVIFLTELTSNTATTATLVPLLAALAPGLGLEPMLLVVPAALAASCAFMLPVATPPNAIVFGSGLVRIGEMTRAGLWLNVAGIALITALAQWWLLPVLVG